MLCAGALAAGAASAKTVWLCKPGLANDACDVSLSTTLLSPTGKHLGVRHIKKPRRPKFDCFYVYPTVSDQQTPAANFDIDPELRSIALYQASRTSWYARARSAAVGFTAPRIPSSVICR